MTDGATEQPAKKATTRRRTAKKAAPAAGTASGGAHKAEPSRRVLQRQIMPIDRDFDIFALYVDAEDATLDADKYEIGGSKAAKDLNNAAIRQATSTGRGIGPDQIESRTALRVRAGERLSLGTYFNAFPASYWRRWTVVGDVRLTVRVSGRGATGYISAVSQNWTPRSSARSIWAWPSASLFCSPQVIVPRQTAETRRPLRPSERS